MTNTHNNALSKTHKAAWKVFGRGASKTFTAALPAGTGEPGQHVELTSKAGNVTRGTLTEVHSQADGLDCWTFSKASKSAAERAADRARTAEANAAYWASEQGVQTMARREARNARKADKADKAAAAHSEAPAASKAASKAPAAAADVCEVCNRKRKNLTQHTAGMAACPQCLTCENATAVKRASRHGWQAEAPAASEAPAEAPADKASMAAAAQAMRDAGFSAAEVLAALSGK